MKSFLRFLSRNRLYTAIEIAGMSIALTFIIFIGTYVAEESSYDKFAGDDIYVGTDGSFFGQSGTIKSLLDGKYPEIISSSRMIGTKSLMGISMTYDTENGTFSQNAMAVDSNFLSIMPLQLKEGNACDVLKNMDAVIVSESMANTLFPEGNATGNVIDISVSGEKASLTVTGVFRDMERTVLPDCDMIYRLEKLESMYPNLTRNGNGTTVTLYRIAPGSDIGKLEENILGILNESDVLYISGLSTGFRLVPFKEIHYGSIPYPFPFENIVNGNVIKLFSAAGILLLVFALLNYISLTTAQTGFRVREMAVRQLIGSTRGGIIARYISESFLITLTSFILGFALAQACAPWFGILAGKYYDPLACLDLRTSAMWTAIILALSVLAGIIPALIVSKYRPVSIVKGEFSRVSKMILGKIFLTVQYAVAIASLSITFAMFLQLRHMIKKPMGYSMDSLINVTFNGNLEPGDMISDGLRSLPCVQDLGWISDCPASPRRTSWGLYRNGERYSTIVLDGDTTALRLLGVKILSRNADPVPYSLYITKRSLPAFGGDPGMTLLEYDGGAVNVCGIIDDLWMGNANSTDNPLLVWCVADEQHSGMTGRLYSMVVKVHGDADKAVKEISRFLEENHPELKVTADTYNNIYISTYSQDDRNLKLTGIFAMLTIVMTIMAILAMSTWYAKQNSKTMAIRKIMGCSRESIYLGTLRNFMAGILVAAVIAIPCAYTVNGKWIQGYGYHIGNYWWIYAAALLAVSVTAAVSISYRAAQLMNTDPADELRKD